MFQILMEPSFEDVMICSEFGEKHNQVTALWEYICTYDIRIEIIRKLIERKAQKNILDKNILASKKSEGNGEIRNE